MRQLAFINGSPKRGESCSLYMIDYLSQELKNTFSKTLTVNALSLLKDSDKTKVFQELLSCEALVIVFPLYVDSLPSSLLEMLADLDHYKKSCPSTSSFVPSIYGLANCGFIDSFQNKNALHILENYALSAGFRWYGGIGLGGGEMIRSTKDQIPLVSKVAKPVYEALCTLIASIKALEPLPVSNTIIFGNYKFKQRIFIVMANFFWLPLAKKNGLTLRKLYAKPDLP